MPAEVVNGARSAVCWQKTTRLCRHGCTRTRPAAGPWGRTSIRYRSDSPRWPGPPGTPARSRRRTAPGAAPRPARRTVFTAC